MRNYYRIMLGQKSKYAEQCFQQNFIGAHFDINEDLMANNFDNWRDFNKHFIPIWQNNNPGKSKIAAGLSCGALWSICKGILKGDIVLCPNGYGQYVVGEVVDNYSYHPDEILPHRRTVKWFSNVIERSSMSEPLQNSTGSIGTVSNVSKFAEEIERLIGGNILQITAKTDDAIEDPTFFIFEKYLEDFLVKNWQHTPFGANYDIYEEDGQLVGQQYQSDSGPIDILAISKNKTELLVVELKRGRASDTVVGQIQRYMGYVLEELAENNQKVKGVIIALEDDFRVKRALAVATNVDFYRYELKFNLIKS